MLEALDKLTGKVDVGLPRIKMPISNDYTRKGDRAQFLKAQINGDHIDVLEGQSSAMLYTYTMANALVYVPIEISEYKKGDEKE